jgi:TPR repeat protein
MGIAEMANCFLNGTGVKKSPEAATSYLRFAADMGDIAAQERKFIDRVHQRLSSNRAYTDREDMATESREIDLLMSRTRLLVLERRPGDQEGHA